MLSIQVEQVVNALVKQLLINNPNRVEGQALKLHLDCRMSYRNSEDRYPANEYNSSRGLHLIYHLHPRLSYVDVFSAVRGAPFDKNVKMFDWKHETSHDSEWAHLRVLSQVYFDMANYINSLRVANDLPEVAPIAMSEHNNFAMFGNMFDWVNVKLTKDPEDSYRKLLTILP